MEPDSRTTEQSVFGSCGSCRLSPPPFFSCLGKAVCQRPWSVVAAPSTRASVAAGRHDPSQLCTILGTAFRYCHRLS